MKKQIILSVLMVFALIGVRAQEEAAPSQLKELLKQGLENNYVLKIARAEQEQRKNNATLENSGILPTASASASYDFSSDNTKNQYTIDPFTKKYTSNDHYIDAGLSLDWTIFDGFEIKTNYERLKELERQGQVETKITIEDYIASFTAEYFTNIMERKRLENLRSAVALSRERLRIVRARYTVGTLSRLDLMQARVDFNADSASCIQQQEVLYTSSVNLSKMLVSKNLNKHIEIVDSLIRLDTTLRRGTLYAAMIENNAELLYADKNTRIAELNYKIVSARNYPYVTFGADYGYDYNKYSYGTTRSNRGLDFGAGITVGFTLFDGTRKAARKNAQLDVDMAVLSRQDVELELNAQFTILWQAYVNNIKLLILETANIKAAQENYNIAMERYLLGDLSGIEMREAQISLLDAEDRTLQATYDSKICEISLLQISGQIEYYL